MEDGASPYRFLVAGAMLVNAIAGHVLYRSGFANAGREPWLAATLLAVFVGGIGLGVALRPSPLLLGLARGAAAGMLLGLAGIAFLTFLAANFESGIPSGQFSEIVLFGLGILLVQVAIFVGTALVDKGGLANAVASTAIGAFQFWLVLVAVIFITQLLD
jgi:hypothetical protein